MEVEGDAAEVIAVHSGAGHIVPGRAGIPIAETGLEGAGSPLG
jgi:hypothetical protein